MSNHIFRTHLPQHFRTTFPNFKIDDKVNELGYFQLILAERFPQRLLTYFADCNRFYQEMLTSFVVLIKKICRHLYKIIKCEYACVHVKIIYNKLLHSSDVTLHTCGQELNNEI